MPSFLEALEELPADLQEKVTNAVAHFVDRTAENSLRPEQKNGFDNVWSFRVGGRYRVFYSKERDSEGAIFRLFHIGHHDDYRIIKKHYNAFRVQINIRNNTKNV